ncbi:MAG: cation:proton antiporter [Candidatus Eremiobacteraeota bacterium]|nr:cation:proton antiporter [Candidatus Eremiobacteraeota bacterium]
MKLWHIAAAVIAGLLAGEIRPGFFGNILRDATLYVFLPALVFEAAWQLDAKLMRRAWKPIVLLAVPGVAITAGVIAAAVHVLGGMALLSALILGAVLSATDPVAVVAIFRRLEVPRILATIVESEALLNDAVAVVLYRGVIAAIFAGATSSSLGWIALTSIVGSIAGIAIGIAGAWAISAGLRESTTGFVRGTLTFLGGYAAYYAAELVHASGIFAIFSLAIVLRKLVRDRDSSDVAAGVDRVWTATANVANMVLFFLVGAAVTPGHFWNERVILMWTIAGVIAARILVAYGLFALVPRLARSWNTVVQMAGVRGALSLALALGIPAGVAQRSQIVDATFAVVVLTILAGSLTYERHIATLDLEGPHRL